MRAGPTTRQAESLRHTPKIYPGYVFGALEYSVPSEMGQVCSDVVRRCWHNLEVV